MLITSQCQRHQRDIAEAYLLGHMTRADAVVFWRHYLGCPRCRHALREERELIRAFRVAGCMIATGEGHGL